MAVTKSETQVHVGDYYGRPIFHSDNRPVRKWWTGFIFHNLSDKQLFKVALSIVFDLIALHPELGTDLLKHLDNNGGRGL